LEAEALVFSREMLLGSEKCDDGITIQSGCLLFQRHVFFLSHSSSSAKYYSIQYQTKLLLADFLFRFTGWQSESSSFEALGEQTIAGAIPRHQL